MRKNIQKLSGRILAAGAAAFVGVAIATQLDIAETPLFLSSGADPNIMLMVDDATSMDFQMAGDVSLLNGAGSASRYPEVDQGEPIGFRCQFSLANILADIASLNLLALTTEVQSLVQCVAASNVEGSNGLLPVEALTNSPLGAAAIAGGLLDNSLTLNLLNPPQYHYAYLNDTDDNYFVDSAADYTNGFLPVMLEEAYINPSSALSIAEGNGSSNANYRPPAISKYTCVKNLLNNDCSTAPLIGSTWNDTARRPLNKDENKSAPLTGKVSDSTSPDDRNICQYPAYSFKGAASNYVGATQPANTTSPGYWRAWNSTYNPIAYNPNITYLPWKGYDSTGAEYGNAVATAARLDPYDPTRTYNITQPQRHRGAVSYRCGADMFSAIQQGDVGQAAAGNNTFKQLVATPPITVPAYTGHYPPKNVDETTSWNSYAIAHNDYGLTYLQLYPARYYTWVDNNGDGRVQSWETHQLVQIRSGSTGTCPTDGSAFGAICPASFARPATRTDCAGGSCTAAQELQNYANWFQYYRRRELVAKAAYSQVIADKQSVRMGMAVIVKNNTTNVTPLGSNVFGNVQVARRVEPLNASYTGGSKKDLLNHLQRVNSGGGGAAGFFSLGKPLRSGLFNVGQSMQENGGNVFNLPAYDTSLDGTINSTCPILNEGVGGACQQNYAVVLTDGFWGGDTVNVQNEDNGNPTNTTFDESKYGDAQSNTLADVAMRFYEQDAAPSLPPINSVINGVDQNRDQHLVTYTIAFGVNGVLTADPAANATSFNWPDPTASDEAKIDDLRHAAVNGRGKFLVATDTQTLKDSLVATLEDITARSSSASSVALNSGSLNTGTTLFQARFDSQRWTGNLQAFPVSAGPGRTAGCPSNAQIGQVCTAAPLWDASVQVKAQNWDSGRTILTYNDSSKTGASFRWASLSAAQQALLNKDLSSNTTDTQGAARLAYIRGDASNESASAFRVRSATLGLGDIINSDPFFVGAPKAPYDGFSGYGDFRAAKKGRRPMVYVGANDGMLHGFEAATGNEKLAYVPGDLRVYADLPLLTQQDYSVRHRYFMDGSVTVADAQVNGNWKTVLTTGLRSGGQTVVALDVTDPSDFSEGHASDIVLWQFSDKDDADLGYTFGRQNLVKMQNGKWVVVFGNGYNNSELTASDTAVGNSEACIFMLDVNGPGADKVWDLGTDYQKICVRSGGPSNLTKPNGMATPAAVDLDGDNVIDAIYAGDLEGNLWKFDVSASNWSNWKVAYNTAGANPQNPLFRTCSRALNNVLIGGDTCDDSRQPITSRPEIGPHPDGPPSTSGVLVYFGTGKYIENADKSPINQPTQSFYMVYDQLWNRTGAPALPTLPMQRADLVAQQIVAERNSSGGSCVSATGTGLGRDCFRLVTDNPVRLRPTDGVPTDQGWYLDLLDTEFGTNTNNKGERVVADPILRGQRIVFSTLIPNNDICSFGGTGWLMELQFNDGSTLDQPPFDVNGDNKIDDSDKIPPGAIPPGGSCPANTVCTQNFKPAGRTSDSGLIPRPTILAITPESGLPTKGCMEMKYTSGSSGQIDKIGENCDYLSGRLTWRQIR